MLSILKKKTLSIFDILKTAKLVIIVLSVLEAKKLVIKQCKYFLYIVKNFLA